MSVNATVAQAENHSINAVLEHNIQTIVQLRKDEDRKRTRQERLADIFTDTTGTIIFLYLNLAFYVLWFIINGGAFGLTPIDPFPFSFLNLLVGLEAIVLSCFVLISQNRNGTMSERRSDLALQMSMLTEHELTRVLQLLDEMATGLNVEPHKDQDLIQLEQGTRPEDVLAEITRVRDRAMQQYGK